VPIELGTSPIEIQNFCRNILLNLQRSVSVKVKAQDLAGKRVNLTLRDWQARIFQHEYDHLQVSPPALSFNH